MMKEELYSLADESYKKFQGILLPTVNPDTILGVRIPAIRKLAKKYKNTPFEESFMNELPHDYYDENMLHGLLINEMKDFGKCILEINRFLPFVDNWAVCDSLSPKVLGTNKKELLRCIRKWLKSKDVYAVRFGIRMLMVWYLGDDFKEEYLKMVSEIRSSEYYVNMMVSWYFAEALVKQWDSAVKYIEEGRLFPWCHNKTIEKARESFRITEEKKKYLDFLKRKDE